MSTLTTTVPDTGPDVEDATETAEPELEPEDEAGQQPEPEQDAEPEQLCGPEAAFAAAMDLAVAGEHVHLVASGENECISAHCIGAVSTPLLQGVL